MTSDCWWGQKLSFSKFEVFLICISFWSRILDVINGKTQLIVLLWKNKGLKTLNMLQIRAVDETSVRLKAALIYIFTLIMVRSDSVIENSHRRCRFQFYRSFQTLFTRAIFLNRYFSPPFKKKLSSRPSFHKISRCKNDLKRSNKHAGPAGGDKVYIKYTYKTTEEHSECARWVYFPLAVVT